MTPEFERALGGMRDVPQWFVWELTWNAADGKYDKVPTDGHRNIAAKDPANWLTYDRALSNMHRLRTRNTEGVTYALGFWLTTACGYWFLDIDKARDAAGGWAPFAQQLCAAFPGAMVEASSSGKGLHVFGRGTAPENHRNRPTKDVKRQIAPLDLEFYTNDRGIAFGLDGTANGSADMACDVAPLVHAYFGIRTASDLSDGPRPEWRGPLDDDVLIERMLNSRQSAASAFGGKASFAQLWRGECERNSESDMALASHLGFWTGCHVERIDRLMRRSALVRDKWNEHRPGGTYLTFTIERACDGIDTVYQEPARELKVMTEAYGLEAPSTPSTVVMVQGAHQRITPEMFAKVDALCAEVQACGQEIELHNDIIPRISEAGIPMVQQERIVGEVLARLKLFGNKMPIAKLRAIMFPPAQRALDAPDGALPDWAKPYCYIATTEQFFNTQNGVELSMGSYHATYGRFMPLSDTGRRENAAERCLHFWGMPIAERTGYRPDQDAYYHWEGVSYANLYSPTSLPPVATQWTEAGLKGIQAFQQHLFDMCGRRDEVFRQVLYWMAHNVQRPGIKIRWSPIIKGVHGDGKTLVFAVLRAAMGYRNVSTTSNSNISNSGGFTDWAVRGAVNVIEEIMLTGKVRHQLYNSMKEFISNNIVDINPKGAKPYQAYNCTNHAALTNHNDGLPLEKTERRWLVVFTPWATLSAMISYCGLGGAAGWKERTDSIDHAKNHCADELRAWFLSLQIPAEFDANGSAMITPEFHRMIGSGTDDAESAALGIIQTGSVGITEDLFSSSHLSKLLELRSKTDGFDMPRGSTLNHMITRLGYSKLEKQVKWNGQTYTIWLRNGVEASNDEIRLALDASNHTQTQLKPPLTP